jgi:hypothetical protein
VPPPRGFFLPSAEKLFECAVTCQPVEQFPAAFRRNIDRPQLFPLFPQFHEPRSILGAEDAFKFFPQPLGERRALPAC